MAELPRVRRYPMRPFGFGNEVCRAFDVPPMVVNHTAQPIARWEPTSDGRYLRAEVDFHFADIGPWIFQMPSDSIVRP